VSPSLPHNTMKIVATNRKAFHEYEIVEKIEAGLSLLGCEVKSIRQGKIDLKSGYVRFSGDEAFLENVNISQYSHTTNLPYEPVRPRKLLLKKSEIKKLTGKVTQKGLSVVPIECYFNDKGMAKVLVALVRGKRQYDKKEVKKRKDIERQMRRDFADKFKT